MTQATENNVEETTTSTGTGDKVLAGAVTGRRTFSSAAADTNTVPYHIYAVDSNGNPSGAWEDGIGIYNSVANSITPLIVLASSNSNAAVNFAAGTKRIANVLLSEQMYKLNGVPFRQLESLSVGLDSQIFWGFFAGLEGWTTDGGADASLTFDSSNSKGILLEDLGSTLNFALISPDNLGINGSKYRRIKLSITLITNPTSGSVQGFNTSLQYKTAGHGVSATYQKTDKLPPSFQPGDTHILDYDMDASTDPADWMGNTILRIRFYLSSQAIVGQKYRINWIAVGTNRPPASRILSPDVPFLAGNPDPGYILAQAKKGAMIHPSWLDEFGAIIMAQPFIANTNVVCFFPANGSTGTGTGFGIPWTSNGNPTHPTPSNTKSGQIHRTRYANVITTADQTLGPLPGASAICFLRGNAAGLGGIFYYARWVIDLLPDGTFRLFSGLCDVNTTMVANDSPTGHFAALWHGTTDPLSGAGAFKLITRDGTTQNTISITPATAIAQGQGYEFYLYAPCNNAAIPYKLVLISDGSTVAEGTLTSNLPGNTTMLAPQHTMSNAANTASANNTANGVANVYCRSIN